MVLVQVVNRHIINVTDKNTGISQDLMFNFKDHIVKIFDENNNIYYNSSIFEEKENTDGKEDG